MKFKYLSVSLKLLCNYFTQIHVGYSSSLLLVKVQNKNFYLIFSEFTAMCFKLSNFLFFSFVFPSFDIFLEVH